MQYSLLSCVHLVDVEELCLGEVHVVTLDLALCVLVEMLNHVNYLALVLLVHHQVLG